MSARKSTRRILILFLLLAAVSASQAQEAADEIGGDGEGTGTLPRQYRSIALGMAPDEVKNLLSEDPWFAYRGDPDVSLLERPRASVIDAGGSLFIDRGLFQFEDEALASIMLELDPETIDWFTVYTTLEERYGPPADMNPSKAWWEDGSTRLALERPLTVKYLDLGVFRASVEEKTDRITWRENARNEFLDEF